MKYLKLFESFSESFSKDILDILKRIGLYNWNYKINSDGTLEFDTNEDSFCWNYKLNSDGTIDYDQQDNEDGGVDLSGELKEMNKIPIKFREIIGHFWCFSNKLTTLVGSPKEVSGNFICGRNKLTTLEGGPIKVGGNFMCEFNNLTSLIGSPTEVGGDFCCNKNELINLDGAPVNVGGIFTCWGNPIWEVYKLFPNHKSYLESLDYNYLRGTDIDKRRLEEALDELGISIPNKIKGYNWI